MKKNGKQLISFLMAILMLALCAVAYADSGSYCSGCGRSVKPDFNYCPYCGRRLKNIGSIVLPTPTPTPKPTQRPSFVWPTPTPVPSAATSGLIRSWTMTVPAEFTETESGNTVTYRYQAQQMKVTVTESEVDPSAAYNTMLAQYTQNVQSHVSVTYKNLQSTSYDISGYDGNYYANIYYIHGEIGSGRLVTMEFYYPTANRTYCDKTLESMRNSFRILPANASFTGYVTKVSQIPDQLTERLKKETESIIMANVPPTLGSWETFDRAEYAGMYLLTANYSGMVVKNLVGVVYKNYVTVRNAAGQTKQLSYYYSVGYKNLYLQDGNWKMDLGDYTTPSTTVTLTWNNQNYSYYGYKTISNMVTKCIFPYGTSYTVTSTPGLVKS